jgi:hypothetical protein
MSNDPDKHAPGIGPKPEGVPDAKISFWDDADKGGQQFILTNEDCPYVGDRFNDQISSLEVLSGTWRIYVDSTYRGESWELKAPRYLSDLRQIAGGDYQDSISSVSLVSYDPGISE